MRPTLIDRLEAGFLSVIKADCELDLRDSAGAEVSNGGSCVRSSEMVGDGPSVGLLNDRKSRKSNEEEHLGGHFG